MPKMKFHSGAKKRFKKTATGKLKARHAFSSHILEEKSPKRKRAFGLDRRGGHRKARAQSPSRKRPAQPTFSRRPLSQSTEPKPPTGCVVSSRRDRP
jgi:large subunit ribosomal protein L35